MKKQDSKTLANPDPSPPLLDHAPCARLLSDWFSKSSRDLPWRQTYDPYGVWVSEVMLQQTRVSVAVPYYLRWMRRLPDIASLARAHASTVLSLWEGLGYYQRPRNMQQAAKVLCRENRCRLPEAYEDLIRLPGLGDYTAAAVSSIAFQKPHPAVDGNVKRVFSRLLDRPGQTAAFVRDIKSHILKMMDHQSPRVLTQALMELGALICTKDTPSCAPCPLRHACLARTNRTQPLRPARPATKTPVRLALAIGILRRNNRFLLRRRPETGLMPSLWEFPGTRVAEDDDRRLALLRLFQTDFGLSVRVIAPFRTIRFSYTTFRVTAEAFLLDLTDPPDAAPPTDSPTPDSRWAEARSLSRLPMPAAYRRLADELEKNES